MKLPAPKIGAAVHSVVRTTASLMLTALLLLLLGVKPRAVASSVRRCAHQKDPQGGQDKTVEAAEAALAAGDKAAAAQKYAEAAEAAPAMTGMALKAAQLLGETGRYVDSASLAARVHETSTLESERKAAGDLLDSIRPHYQKSVDLLFVEQLRQIKAGRIEAAAPQIRKVWRLICDPEEGLLTMAFVQFGVGDVPGSVSAFKQWFASAHRTPQELISSRLATYYDPYVVQDAIANDEVRAVFVKAFGRFVASRLSRAADDARVGIEPVVQTVNPKDGAIMLQIPAGNFIMGDRGATNNPRRTVALDEFWIYKNLVTVDMYRKFCKATGARMPPEPIYTGFHFNPDWKKGNNPMVNVSWVEAASYCKWAGVRLPTEAQWEKAARGQDGRRYPWGNSYSPHLLHHSNDDGDAHGTTAVGSFPGGASPYGALDMAGMVFQWCSDYYMADYWKYAPEKNPSGPSSGRDRVAKSGSWYDDDDIDFVATRRTAFPSGGQSILIGFRCAMKP